MPAKFQPNDIDIDIDIDIGLTQERGGAEEPGRADGQQGTTEGLWHTATGTVHYYTAPGTEHYYTAPGTVLYWTAPGTVHY